MDKERESQPDARPHPTCFGVECPAILNKSGAWHPPQLMYCPPIGPVTQHPQADKAHGDTRH